MKLLLLMVFLFALNVALAFATKSHFSTFVAGLVGGLLIADLVKYLNRGDRR